MPKTLNFNKMQKPSLRIELADWDIYDIQMFYRTYIDYLLEIKNSKN